VLVTIQRLTLGILLILLVSAALLFSDWTRRSSTSSTLPRLALVQIASQAVLDEGIQGMLQGLEETGFVPGKTLLVQRFNAENDLPTANAVANEIVARKFDLVLTASTLSLQTVAKANAAGHLRHVFGLVTDPGAAGVGISRDDPLAHPKHLAGYGTLQPVDKAFRLARELFPALKTVGVVWNPAEPNSEASTRQARQIAGDLGITLLEANVDNSSGVFEAAGSLISRGVQAFWVGGDVTVMVAIDAVITAARGGGIPVFTNVPPTAERGALFDVGADYHEVGRLAGVLAGQVLQGHDPAGVPIQNVVPERVVVNEQALVGLRDPWQVPAEVLAKADEVIDRDGHKKLAQRTARRPAAGRTYKIGIAYFAPEPGADSTMQGLFAELEEQGFTQGVNLEVRKLHAQGEIGNIPMMLQTLDAQDLDLIVPLTTPCLTAAATVVRKTPVVFVYVYDPIAAGAGSSFTEHLPTLTGVGSFPPIEDTVTLLQQVVPGVKAVGTLYNSSEANSRKVVSVARERFAAHGIRLEEVTITNTSEVYPAAGALAARGIQALWITGDNTALQAFEGIAKIAADARLPLIINDPEFTARGALAAVGIGFYHSGRAAAKLAARVLLGESPAGIPIENVAVQEVVLNQEVARKLGIIFPPQVTKRAEEHSYARR
jgi:ABC-type uncharacterized transport system substrate-binding protein